MKNKVVLAAFIIISINAHSQEVHAVDMNGYFFAVIVKNIDSSTAWYQGLLGMKVKNRPDAGDGFKVVILESPKLVLELIENKSWPNQKELLKGTAEGTHIEGFFKIGFKVLNMDACINHLKHRHISIDRIYTDPEKKRNFLISDPDGNLIQFFE